MPPPKLVTAVIGFDRASRAVAASWVVAPRLAIVDAPVTEMPSMTWEMVTVYPELSTALNFAKR